jgi:phosphatidylserine/phosphatidylglycerophosphate/cardiolipin synthase-like enzyme
VAVLQASVDPESSFWRETVRAAERGVRVRVILSGAWYVREENAAKVERLNERAERASLPIEAKLAEGGDRFGALHAKGAVIDRERVIVGSLNWNPHAARENREVVLVLDGPVAGYYADAFDADWSGGGTGLPIGFVGVVLAAVAVAAWVVRRVVVRAEGDPAVEHRY